MSAERDVLTALATLQAAQYVVDDALRDYATAAVPEARPVLNHTTSHVVVASGVGGGYTILQISRHNKAAVTYYEGQPHEVPSSALESPGAFAKWREQLKLDVAEAEQRREARKADLLREVEEVFGPAHGSALRCSLSRGAR